MILQKTKTKTNLATLVLPHNLKRWAQHSGKRVAQETKDIGVCTRGSCRFRAFNSVVNICSKAFYFAQINLVIPSGLGPGWAYRLYLLQNVFFFFLFKILWVVNREDIWTFLVMFPSCLLQLVLM